MSTVAVPRLLLAAPQSGSGKTTVVCALLRALVGRGKRVVAFKSGPDYIDPAFHRRITGTASRNLDLFLLGRHEAGAVAVRRILAEHGAGADMAVIEGAMGYYDGIGLTAEASAYDLARVTETPVILVVDGKGSALSLAASLKGLASFRHDSHVAGFIVNHVKPSVYAYYRERWEQESGLCSCGYLPPLPECRLENRHLGLVGAAEVATIDEIVARLGRVAGETLDLERLCRLAEQAPAVAVEPLTLSPVGSVRVAVARDEAFCFYYDDVFDLLRRLGAELVFFSPLHDAALPDCEALYLGGGYPELHASALSGNASMRRSIRDALGKGLPCFAECGGYMYLQQGFGEGTAFTPWVSAIPTECTLTDKLRHFGYIELTAQEDTLLCRKGETITAHEFHYSASDSDGTAFTAVKASGKGSWPAYYSCGNLLAGYPHLHLYSRPQWAARFLRKALAWKKERIGMSWK
ncbi:cobyrinate a,c-diamide synthase [Megasphaera vaginalis (ex Srinivasan et al. 2021)]|uniref:Cobyrinate a,c-diamide synthase n=1 Tax=Megasphaera vaginalis (ex Srinivasan et al. 2021) TaxID=1111454 RepID=U7UQU5_9FIRM|nr:cobyrinate a,c-diamide synthase [Megasphaera vaginalis (ex Srinivasan et al. 2021)]ERT61812.1 cobyrinic acid a,c-diamide synthase [Megasphaera vaginalis (ex Srinivasan et al. 2021)]